jgi:methylated-DNA-[protein]-cysteine S-methyltransferase
MRNINVGHLIYIWYYMAPCGVLLLGEREGKLCLCDWNTGKRLTATYRRMDKLVKPVYAIEETALLAEVVTQLDEYFAGRRTEMTVPLMAMGTEFEQCVWKELLKIPYGATISYAELARRIDNPTAVRAVANAVGANRLSVFIPCHRVIGSDGSLTGYAGGLAAKRFLLGREQKRN